jgi:hypothetical protein
MMRMAQTLALLEVPGALLAEAVQGAVVVGPAQAGALRPAGVVIAAVAT